MKMLIQGTLFIALCAFCTTPASAEHKNLREMMTQSDTNKDGMVSEEEFINSKKEYFLKMDKDRNGSLDGNEQTAMAESIDPTMKDDARTHDNKMKTGKM